LGSASREDESSRTFFFSFFVIGECLVQQKTGVLDQHSGLVGNFRKYYHSTGVRRVWWPARQHGIRQVSKIFRNKAAGRTQPNELFNDVPDDA
jgi:hypothetical protein